MNRGRLQLVLYAIFLLVIAGIIVALRSVEMLAFGAFIIALGTLIFKDRSKVRFEGLAFIRRTDRANRFIDQTAKRHPTFWRTLSIAGIVVAIPVMAIGSVYMLVTAVDVATGRLATGGAGIVLPGPVSAPFAAPGVFVVPWWIWIIGIACVIIPHEFFHGIMFRLQHIRVKSVGWVVFLVLPGAFVEPDDNQLKRSARSTKLKAFAAGSFANLLIAFIIAVALSIGTMAAPASDQAGIFFQQVEDSPAAQYNITGAITALNGVPVHTQAELGAQLERYAPGDTVTVTTRSIEGNASVKFTGAYDFIIPAAGVYARLGQEKNYVVALAAHPQTGDAFLGVTNVLQVHSTDGGLAPEFINLLVWIYVFSFGIGLVNLLPLKPLDGGLLFEEIIQPYTRHTKTIVRTVSVAMLLLLLFNIFGVFFI